jgi:hypothetical protein
MAQTSDNAGRQLAALSRWDDEGGAAPGTPNKPTSRYRTNASIDGPDMERPAMRLAVDQGPHNRDGLLLHGWDKTQAVTAFIARKVMDEWAAGERRANWGESLFHDEYNALGVGNLAAIERIVRAKYDRGAEFNSHYPFVDLLLEDIADSGERLDRGALDAERAAPASRPARLLS